MDAEIRLLFPADMLQFWQRVVADYREIREIRLRIQQPILIRRGDGEYFLDEAGNYTQNRQKAHLTKQTELEKMLMHLCHDSPYAFEEELKQGFMTVAGGHRVGVCGQVVLDADGKIKTMKHIYYLNIRIAHQILGVAEGILPYLYDTGQLQNTLIVSPPGCGKTTLLRELIRVVSEGNVYGKGMQVSVVDERSEIAGTYLGRPVHDLGCRTDVLDACPKRDGMLILLRSMTPQVLAVDELGDGKDFEAIRAACACGCKLLATVHGNHLEDVKERFLGLDCLELFERVLVLGKLGEEPGVRKIYRKDRSKDAFGRSNSDFERVYGTWVMVSKSIYRQAANQTIVGETDRTAYE